MTSLKHDHRVRVIQVTHDLGVGGLPRVVETLSTHLDPDRYEVEVFCLREGGPLKERLAQRGIETYVMDRPPTRLRADYFTAGRVRAHMAARRPAIVHTHNTEPFLEGGLGAKMAGVPILVHTDHARDFPDKWRYMFLERLMSFFADAVVAVSDDGLENLHRYVKIPRSKLSTILNGVDGGELSDERDVGGWRQRLGIESDAPVIGLGARFSDQKGITYLLDAMPSVLEEYPNTHLVLAGYGELEGALKRQSSQLGLDERVHFPGKVDSMSELLTAFDIFALPSIWEGLPMAILESMAARVPIVATEVGGVGAALTDGESGILVPPADPAAFADGLKRALASRELRAGLAAEARRTFDERFSADAMARGYAELYESLLEKRGLESAAGAWQAVTT